MNNLTEYIKKAFDYKQEGHYKESIDYFYKALAIDNNSCEIMSELAFLYSKLHQYDRSISFYEQVLAKNPDDYQLRFEFSMMYKKIQDYVKAQECLEILFGINFNVIQVAEELFSILLKQNKFDRIIDLYNSRANSLKSSIIFYFVGQAYLETGKINIADEFFKKSFETDEENIEAGCKIASMLFNRTLYDDAEKLLIKLLKHSESDKIYYLLAEINYLKADYDNSIKYYCMAIRLNDKEAEYFYKLGVVYALKGFFIEAEENYSRAITIEHENILYNYTLAYLYFMNDKKDYALRIVDYILSLNNDYLNALSLKLLICIDKDILEAKKIVDRLSERNDKEEFSYYCLGMYYSSLNMWSKAIINIEKAILYNPKSCEYNYELAKCYFELNNYDKAGEICNNIIQLNKKFVNAYILLARILYIRDDFNKAAINLDEALKLDINISEVYFIKGLILKSNNKIEEAVNNFKIALLMSPDKVKYYKLAADCYFEMQNYKEAYLYYKEAADIDVSNGEYKYLMAKCCEELNDYDNALANYSLARRLSSQNIVYLCDYLNLLIKTNNKKNAVNLIKSSLKLYTGADREKLNHLLKECK